MIEPNFTLLLWFVFIVYGVRGVISVITGALQGEKPKNYGITDVIGGLVSIFICFLVCIF